jgi:NAD(P)-dependent dehydrogenase (short-subunit alcohol dehydrogenase family)
MEMRNAVMRMRFMEQRIAVGPNLLVGIVMKVEAVRNEGRQEALAERLKDETGRSVETIAADLSNKADLARIETTLSTNPSITLLVNNADVGATARAQIKCVDVDIGES